MFTVRIAEPTKFKAVGALMVQVYSQLEGFPSEKDQPSYYELLRNVGDLTKTPSTEILVAVSETGAIGGAVVYFGDMKDYGSGGTATMEKNACGFRLLAVDPEMRGQGLGKLLSIACIEKSKKSSAEHLIIHTTNAMQVAWKMYEKLGFERATDLDFLQESFPVFGFRLALK